MKNKHFNLTSGIVLILIPLVFSFTGCKDDYETYYEGYGLVSKSGDEKFTVKLDDGYLLYPREYYFNPEKYSEIHNVHRRRRGGGLPLAGVCDRTVCRADGIDGIDD